jgi:hypothetical protein
MQRPFDLLEERADVVQVEPRPQCAKVTRRDGEGCARFRSGECRQPSTQGVVDNVAERASRAARLRLQPRCHILVKGQRRPHIMMLYIKHHDVKREGMWGAIDVHSLQHKLDGHRHAHVSRPFFHRRRAS